MAKMACKLAKQNGMVQVMPGEEASFLGPYPVSLIPGVGPVMCQKLKDKNIHTIHDINQFSLEEMTQLFGKWGVSLFLKAKGQGSTSGVKTHDPKRIGHERTFDKDTDNPVHIRRHLIKLAEKVGRRLRAKAVTARQVVLKIRYADFLTVSKQKTISPTDDDLDIFETAVILFKQLFNPNQKIRLIGISCGNLEHDTTVPLFDFKSQDNRVCKIPDMPMNQDSTSFN